TPSAILSFNAMLRPLLYGSRPQPARLDLFDDLDLGAVGGLQKADAPAVVVGRHLLEDAHTVGLELGHCPGIVVGVDGDVLDAVNLLAALGGDHPGDVELQPVQIEAAAAARNFGDQLRAEIVDVKLRGLLRILAFEMYVLDGHSHDRSPCRISLRPTLAEREGAWQHRAVNSTPGYAPGSTERRTR